MDASRARVGGALRARRVAALLLALGAVPAAAGETSLTTAVGTGAGWDSNLAGSGTGSGGANPVASAGFVTANAAAGVRLELDHDDLSLELGYDGERYRALYADLDLDRGSATAAWMHAFGDAITFRVAPSAGIRSYGDSARDGWDAGVLAALRFALGDATALRLAGGWRHRAADDPAFEWSSFRARGAIERDLWEGAWVEVAYALDLGSDTFYAPSTATTPLAVLAQGPGGGGGGGSGPGMGPGGSYGTVTGTFGTPLVAYSASRVGQTVSADLSHRWSSGIFVELGYAYSSVSGEYQSYTAHLVTGALGWRR